MSPLCLLRHLFTAMPTGGASDVVIAETVVGPLQLLQYRDLDISALGASARTRLGIPADVPVVAFSGQPDPASPHVLRDISEALSRVKADVPDAVLVVSRHSRDRGIPDNGATHRQVLRYVRDRLGITVLENSWDHRGLPDDDPDAIPAEFQPAECVPPKDLVCACRNGVIVSGFGTDALIVAPHLGILSLLYLNPALFGGLLEREKGIRGFRLPYVPEVVTVERLALELGRLLDRERPNVREGRLRELARHYPFPSEDPAKKIADTVFQLLQKQQ